MARVLFPATHFIPGVHGFRRKKWNVHQKCTILYCSFLEEVSRISTVNLFPLLTAAHPLLSFRRMWFQAGRTAGPRGMQAPQALVPGAATNEAAANHVTLSPAKYRCMKLNHGRWAKAANWQMEKQSSMETNPRGVGQFSLLGVGLSLLSAVSGAGRGNTGCRQYPPSHFYLCRPHGTFTFLSLSWEKLCRCQAAGTTTILS